jgi:hypothetical protein
VIDRAHPERHLPEQVPGHVDLEQVADAFPRVAIHAVDRRRQTRRRDPHFDRGDEQHVTDLDHALGMEGAEPDRDGRHLLPRRLAGELHHPVTEQRARRRRLGDERRNAGRHRGGCQTAHDQWLSPPDKAAVSCRHNSREIWLEAASERFFHTPSGLLRHLALE